MHVLLAYEESVEVRNRQRILELTSLGEGLTSAEKTELASLRTLYPEVPSIRTTRGERF